MAVSSQYTISLSQTGDVEYQQSFTSPTNPTGSGQDQLINLSSGNNTITVPTGAIAVMIDPPTGNAVVLLLKGVAGDTGISLHLTNPSLIALNNVATFVVNAAGAVTGVRFIWS